VAVPLSSAYLRRGASSFGAPGLRAFLLPLLRELFRRDVRFPKYSHVFCGVEIGSSDGDCAPSPSHTTGRAVFRIRRLKPGVLNSR